MSPESISSLLEKAIASRAILFDPRHESAFRLFNGFTEGEPNLVIDLYAKTAIIHNYADPPDQGQSLVSGALDFLQSHSLTREWLRAVVLKVRNGKTQQEKRGQLLLGEAPDRKIREHGISYSIDLTMNRDASFYFDTRDLRKWLKEHMQGKTILNAFAYTGSLGVAALAGGARRVLQHDLNRQFLNVAKASYTLNGFPIYKEDFVTADFFLLIANLKRKGELFDCVLIDPPFFSTTSKGKVDQENDSARLINKVRPLIKDGGMLVAVNNALYVSGQDYLQTLESLCSDGYLRILELIPVPEDCTGYPETRVGHSITDPTPFNHSTKIAILSVRRRSL
jgi:23S rRNA (cytosine1962-C5)-methyltransferase